MLTIIPSIDVEAAHGSEPFEQMILGRVDNANYFGVFKIADIFNNAGCSGTFFVDIYEHTLWGEAKFQDLCLQILDMGQDVQLHTHPSWRHDTRDSHWLNSHKSKKSFLSQDKDFMAKLTLDEQVYVLEHGMTKLYEWTGLTPIAHRSGGYSVNYKTFEAMKIVGLKVDSSCNVCSTNTKFYHYANKPCYINDVIELPVTVGFAHLNLLPFNRLVKTCVNTLSLNELIEWAEAALRNDVRYMSLFMHSYSLLNFDRNFKSFTVNHKSIDSLTRFLDWCNNHESIRIDSIKNIYSHDYCNFILDGSDFIPDVKIGALNAIKYAYKRYLN